jgi:hypothetical protein
MTFKEAKHRGIHFTGSAVSWHLSLGCEREAKGRSDSQKQNAYSSHFDGTYAGRLISPAISGSRGGKSQYNLGMGVGWKGLQGLKGRKVALRLILPSVLQGAFMMLFSCRWTRLA